MAETLLSPGVLARENDQSFTSAQPTQAGAAIIGPTVKGKVGIPQVVTTYSEYQSKYGTTFESGSTEYTYFTSIAAYNYFNNGGDSLLVTRVASGSFTSATSSRISSDEGAESGVLIPNIDLIESYAAGGEGGTAATYTGVSSSVSPSGGQNLTLNVVTSTFNGILKTSKDLIGGYAAGGTGGTPISTIGTATSVTPPGGTGLTLDVVTNADSGKLITTANALLDEINAGTNPTNCGTAVYTSVPIVQAGGVGGLATVTVTGTTAPTITGIDITTQGTGYSINPFTIAAGDLGTGQMKNTDNLFGITTGVATANMGNATAGPHTITPASPVTGGSVQDGTGMSVTLTSDGVSALTAAVVTNIGSLYVTGNVITVLEAELRAAGWTAVSGQVGDLTITLTPAQVEDSSAAAGTLTASDLMSEVESITVNAVGSGYSNGDTVTVAKAFIGTPTPPTDDLTLNLVSADLLVQPENIIVNAQGSGYALGDTVNVALGLIGSPTADLTLTLTNPSIINANAFTLETLAEGILMNSDGTLDSYGALVNGNSDNVRWEITQPNTASGTFSLLVRRGNDNTKEKVVLETYQNISLDPKTDNYVGKVIGGQIEQIREDIDGTPYVQISGSYPNMSRYVRVKDVNLKTPDYFDNSGTAKAQYTASIPVVGSGSFGTATGDLLTNGDKYYENIANLNTQGINADDYTQSISLLSNKDDYVYNVISAPGLVYDAATHVAPLNSILTNALNRGDNIAIIDTSLYGANLNKPITEAASIDNSYGATYWPWCQLTDPDSGQLVWVPASTLIPGVYAYNDTRSEPWFAPAGINRGGLTTVARVERKLPQASRDSLYQANVNPIATFPNTGIVVFGQKTLQKKASALDRVNVRRLLIALKSHISQVADNLVFEQNSIATRNNFLSSVNPYLESVQQRQGLYAFKVVMDESNNTPDVIDRNEMVGQIYLQPTRTAEFIILDFNVMPTGATFPS